MQEWFPYSTNNNVFYFSTGDGMRDTLMTNAIVERSQVVPEQSEGFEQWAEHCSVGSIISSITGAEHPHWLHMNLNHITRGLMEGERMEFEFGAMSIVLYINGGEFSGKLALESLGKYRYDKLDTLKANGREYYDVVMLSVVDLSVFEDQPEPYQVDKVYIAEGKGIIGYRNYQQTKEYWVE